MDWPIVEVAIGLAFLFFLLSVIASALNEAIAGMWRLRARDLEKGISNLPSADRALPVVIPSRFS